MKTETESDILRLARVALSYGLPLFFDLEVHSVFKRIILITTKWNCGQ